MSLFNLSYAANLLILFFGIALGVSRRRVYSVFWIALAAFHLFSLIDLPRAAEKFEPWILEKGQLLMLLGNSLLLAFTFLLDTLVLGKGHAATDVKRRSREEAGLARYANLGILLLLVAMAIRVRSGTSMLLSGWEEARSSLSLLDSFSTMLIFIAAPVPWIFYKLGKPVRAVVACALLVLMVQIFGSRAIILVLGSAVLLDLVLSRRTLLKRFALIAFLGLVMISVHTSYRLVRGWGLLGFSTNGIIENREAIFNNVDLSGGESEIYSYYYFVIYQDARKYPYLSAVTLKRLALMPVPSSLMPELKPKDITYRIWEDYYSKFSLDIFFRFSDDPGSAHPALWGDAFANFAEAGLVLYPLLFGLAIVAAEVAFMKLSPAVVSVLAPLGCVGYMMITRGSVTYGFGYFFYMMPIAVTFLILLKSPILKRPTIWRDSDTLIRDGA